MNIFTKFHKDWTTIVDFLLIAKFWASVLFFCTPSTCSKRAENNIFGIFFSLETSEWEVVD